MSDMIQEAFAPLMLQKCACNHTYKQHLDVRDRKGDRIEIYFWPRRDGEIRKCTRCACKDYDEDNLKWLTNNL